MDHYRTSDIIDRKPADLFVGREQEISTLLEFLQRDSLSVIQIHGISGIGKSSLLRKLSQILSEIHFAVVALDGRNIEPTEAGFLSELQKTIDLECSSVAQAVRQLSGLASNVVIIVDTYEVLRLLDTWLRREFGVRLPVNVRLVLAGREPPVSGWLTDPGWLNAFQGMQLSALPEASAVEFLKRLGIEEDVARQLNQIMNGNPLALRLGAGVFRDCGSVDRATGHVIGVLTKKYLENIPDQTLRKAVESTSIVRRITLPILRSLEGENVSETIYIKLEELPFIERGQDGLIIHDAVRGILASGLVSSDPARYRALRCAAWQLLNKDLELATPTDLWRYTADLLYLIENRIVREAFFPSDFQPYVVEPAHPDHQDIIFTIAKRKEGAETLGFLAKWWQALPSSFKVVKDQNSQIVGFYVCFDVGSAPASAISADPVTTAICKHLKKEQLPHGQNALILRKWLSSEHGEAPSQIQAACWLDVKRTYLEMRKTLRRVYTSAWDVAHYADVLPVLGFKFTNDIIRADGRDHLIAVNDFGPGLVLGWLNGIVGAELGVNSPSLLDENTREIVVNGSRAGLTILEFQVLKYLIDKEPQAVSRDQLLENIWGITHDTSSNVVDVVIRSLRQKLGIMSGSIETVRGIGYRFHNS